MGWFRPGTTGWTRKPTTVVQRQPSVALGSCVHGAWHEADICSSSSTAASMTGIEGRIQPVDATHSLNRSAGVWKPSVLRGLSFNCLAIALSWCCE
jgi:hypothetical protein